MRDEVGRTGDGWGGGSGGGRERGGQCADDNNTPSPHSVALSEDDSVSLSLNK